MLKRLIVSNLALVKKAEINFGEGLNIISGETGSGKSILIDGLMLLLGARYDKSYLRYGAKSGYVEGVFEGSAKKLLNDIGLDEDDSDDFVVVTRKFDENGKNDIRVNGRQITLTMLKNFTTRLVDIYGQNENRYLTNKREHLNLLDFYCGKQLTEILGKYNETRNEYKSILTKLNELGNEIDREKNIEFLKYQIHEIENSHIYDGEEDELILKRKRVTNAQRMMDSLNAAYELLSGNDGISDKIAEIQRNLQFMSRIDSKFDDFSKRLDSVDIELSDIAETLLFERDDLETPEDLEFIEKRLDLIRSLKRKYGDFDSMTKYLSEAKERYELLSDCDTICEKLNAQKKKCFKEMAKLAKSASNLRKDKALDFEKDILDQLKDLGMAGSKFIVDFNEVDFSDEEFYTSVGVDEVEFYLSPNAGQPPKPLIKIISGGEMSRFMLAMKVVSGEMNDISTMIFDEIDSGISGDIGQKVASKLYQISLHKQVLCVTHLPQVAAMADNHFFICKRVENGETITEISNLDDDAKVKEVSRLSGGENISSASIKNAEEMIKWCQGFKSSFKVS